MEDSEVDLLIPVLDFITNEKRWRKVYLQRKEKEQFILLDEYENVLDEPDDGCPASGFSLESLLSDVRLDFYDIATNLLSKPPTCYQAARTASTRSEHLAGSEHAGRPTHQTQKLPKIR